METLVIVFFCFFIPAIIMISIAAIVVSSEKKGMDKLQPEIYYLKNQHNELLKILEEANEREKSQQKMIDNLYAERRKLISENDFWLHIRGQIEEEYGLIRDSSTD